MLLEYLDRRVRNRNDAERAFGLPVLAEVPALRQRERESRELVSYTQPMSRIAEAYRAVRSSLLFQHAAMGGAELAPHDLYGDEQLVPHEPLTVMVTSASPREGKSTSSAQPRGRVRRSRGERARGELRLPPPDAAPILRATGRAPEGAQHRRARREVGVERSRRTRTRIPLGSWRPSGSSCRWRAASSTWSSSTPRRCSAPTTPWSWLRRSISWCWWPSATSRLFPGRNGQSKPWPGWMHRCSASCCSARRTTETPITTTTGRNQAAVAPGGHRERANGGSAVYGSGAQSAWVPEDQPAG